MKYSTLSYNFFTLIKLPAAWISGVRVSKVTDEFCEVKVKYRDVHARTLTNEGQYFPPKERVY